MNGFILKLGVKNQERIPSKQLEQSNIKHLIHEQENTCFEMYYSPMPLFEQDKLLFETDHFIILLDGFILNKLELLKNYSKTSWSDCFLTLYQESPDFMNKLRGSFRGAVYDKDKNSLICFTNHSGEKTAYYYHGNKELVVVSHNDLMKDYFDANNLECMWNYETAYELLTLGYALDNHSPLNNVYRITAGKYVCFDVNTGSLKVERYHMFKNSPSLNLTEEEALKEFDRLYRQAVNRIFAKNEEYGYCHEADISGGLDTRMVNWVAHDLGYRNFININYCHPGGIDYDTAKKLSKDLENEFLYYSMENGDFLMDVDDMVGVHGGQVIYCISTGANRSYSKIKDRNVGIAVTGLVGEMCNAYWRQGGQHTPPAIITNRYSYILDRIDCRSEKRANGGGGITTFQC